MSKTLRLYICFNTQQKTILFYFSNIFIVLKITFLVEMLAFKVSKYLNFEKRFEEYFIELKIVMLKKQQYMNE